MTRPRRMRVREDAWRYALRLMRSSSFRLKNCHASEKRFCGAARGAANARRASGERPISARRLVTQSAAPAAATNAAVARAARVLVMCRHPLQHKVTASPASHCPIPPPPPRRQPPPLHPAPSSNPPLPICSLSPHPPPSPSLPRNRSNPRLPLHVDHRHP